MPEFLKALGIIFAGEMGDKTQLVAMAFATRYALRDVLGGVFLGTMVNHALAVLLGGAVLLVIPIGWIKVAAGLAFIGFGLWTIKGDTLEDKKEWHFASPVLTVALAFFIAEMGDKTQLSTAVLAAEAGKLLPVWLGSSLGMVTSDAVAIAVGVVMGKRLPERAIKIGAAVLFFVFGVFLLVEGVGKLR